MTPETTEKAVKASRFLHNLLRADLEEDHPHAPSSKPYCSALAKCIVELNRSIELNKRHKHVAVPLRKRECVCALQLSQLFSLGQNLLLNFLELSLFLLAGPPLSI